MKKTLIISVLFVGLVLCALGLADSHYRTSIGSVAPVFRVSSDTGSLSLKDLRGSYVLLNFWSSTDAASRHAANDYTAWVRRHPDSRLKLMSVNLDSSPRLFREIVRVDSLIPSTQHYAGGNTAGALKSEYGLNNGLGSVLINPEGKIVAHNPDDAVLNRLSAKG